MSKELNCKWYFGPQAKGNERGPNNPTALTFKGTKYHSLIRESIQNSLDAVDDKSRPVTVMFDYREFSGREFPEFFKLKEHIEGCLNKYPNDENGDKLFKPMLDYFSDFQTNQNIGYLRIVDTNTTGMHYSSNDSKSAFNAFISEGIASKPNGAGGSFGFGKAVFWMLSPISTVFVSSKADNNELNFVGQSKLCTHYLTPGDDLSPNGLYTTDGKGEVVTEESYIPEYFRPMQKGTSVYVLGAPYLDDTIRKELIKGVLRNFWMAVHCNKLVVKVDNVIIDREHLLELMELHFDLINNKEKEIFDYNPRYFYDIVKNAEQESDNYKLLQDTVEMNGVKVPIKFYIKKQPDAGGQFVFMRSPLMSVFSERLSTCKGVDGVFICDSEDGNNHLREMEDCSHDSWSRKNYEARGNIPSIVATHTLNAIKQYIREAVHLVLEQDAQESEQVVGLDKILTISTPKSINDQSRKDEIVDLETLFGKKDKYKEKEKNKVKNKKPSVRQPNQMKAAFDSEGRLLSNSGGKKKKRRIKPGPVKPGSLKNKSKEDENGKKGIYAVPIDVSYRTWSQVANEKVWHIIRIFSDKEIDNALIQVYGVDEEGKSVGLNIEEVIGYEPRVGEEFVDSTDFEDAKSESKGTLKQVKNAIGGVHVNANIPLTIKVRFNSDIKYSLRINSDKIVINENE